VFVFLAIVMSIGGGGAGSCMGVAGGAGSQGAFFLLENPNTNLYLKGRPSFCPGSFSRD
jgi:hypothetical protein